MSKKIIWNTQSYKTLVWVYGTLKRNFWNYPVMESAEGKYIGDWYVEIESLSSCGFPRVVFAKQPTHKWLKVELFEVSQEWIEWPLDTLEWYYPWSPCNLYNRIEVKTQFWTKISVYEITSQSQDVMENYFVNQEWEDKYYNWK